MVAVQVFLNNEHEVFKCSSDSNKNSKMSLEQSQVGTSQSDTNFSTTDLTLVERSLWFLVSTWSDRQISRTELTIFYLSANAALWNDGAQGGKQHRSCLAADTLPQVYTGVNLSNYIWEMTKLVPKKADHLQTVLVPIIGFFKSWKYSRFQSPGGVVGDPLPLVVT